MYSQWAIFSKILVNMITIGRHTAKLATFVYQISVL